MTGRLVVVEGIDGSGKTTLIRALGNLPSVLLTREPTLAPHGKALRGAFGRGERLSTSPSWRGNAKPATTTTWRPESNEVMHER